MRPLQQIVSPRRRVECARGASYRPALIMVAKMLCCMSSIASLSLCAFPHSWHASVHGVSTRWCVFAVASIPVVSHLYDFVFDDEFLLSFQQIHPWTMPTLIALVCNLHSSQTRGFFAGVALAAANVPPVLVAPLSVGVWLACSSVDHVSRVLFAALLLDRALAQRRHPLVCMCARQAAEFYALFTLVASAAAPVLDDALADALAAPRSADAHA